MWAEVTMRLFFLLAAIMAFWCRDG